jgi:hypothetical protein
MHANHKPLVVLVGTQLGEEEIIRVVDVEKA